MVQEARSPSVPMFPLESFIVYSTRSGLKSPNLNLPIPAMSSCSSAGVVDNRSVIVIHKYDPLGKFQLLILAPEIVLLTRVGLQKCYQG